MNLLNVTLPEDGKIYLKDSQGNLIPLAEIVDERLILLGQNYKTYKPVFLQGATNTPLPGSTYENQKGLYIEVGNLVYFSIRLKGVPGRAGDLAFVSLPVPADTTEKINFSCPVMNITGGTEKPAAFAAIHADSGGRLGLSSAENYGASITKWATTTCWVNVSGWYIKAKDPEAPADVPDYEPKAKQYIPTES